MWTYLERVIPQLPGMEMLELNYGTGEDALMFSERGFNLVATDVSEEMLRITHPKKQQYSMQTTVTSHYLDLDSFNASAFNKKFDLILSNFGGLNCINPESLKRLLEKMPSILAPGGRFVAVVMPKFCLWESVFFFFRLRFQKIFRRWTSGEVLDTIYGFPSKMWFYNPAQIRTWAKANFTTVTVKPIGLVLPPVYLENFFFDRKKLLLRLNEVEKRLSWLSFSSGMADNYIIDLRVK